LKLLNTYSILVILLIYGFVAEAQDPIGGRLRQLGNIGRGGSGGDSVQFEKRNFSDDSVTLRFRFLDTARYSGTDSSISDFFQRVPLKQEYIYLGNNGNAIRPILFTPYLKPGWDAGFHAFDPFAFRFDDTRFMTTTRPYTELGYLIGGQAEQMIHMLHTQNAMPDLNFVLQYRLVNAPGYFNSQNSNHKNFRFNANYTSKGRRYNVYFIAMNNSLQSSENGGIESDTFLVNQNGAFDNRLNIPTNLADSITSSRNFFNVKLQTGNRYTETKFLLRQQYDLGIKDSVVTDSTVSRFFYPKLRFEHTIQYNVYNYEYLDVRGFYDSLFYQKNYGIANVPDTVSYRDKWLELGNDFSVIQFPDSKNPLQFFKVGASLQNLKGEFVDANVTQNNIWLHGEYRNRTRSRKWDMLAYGEFHVAGEYAGNYSVLVTLKRLLSAKLGNLEVGFQNVNRTPSFIFDTTTSFPVINNGDLNDENTTHLFGNLEIPALRMRLNAHYYLISNYTYFREFLKVNQEATLFNYLQLGFSKEFRLGKNWRWYTDVYIQTTTANTPINLPFFYTRNRIAYEGRPFRNLLLSTGFDTRYYSSYKTDNYSPVLGQYFFQETETISNRPDITAYLNFRIRNFTAYTRLENLNTMTFKYGFGFKNSNLAAPLYAYPGLLFRLGIFWSFVN
jgi:Putative porin